MSGNLKTFLIVVGIVIAVSGGLIFAVSNSNKNSDSSTYGNNDDNGTVAGVSTQNENQTSEYKEKLAKFLTEKGMVLYGAYWCPHCQDQKKLFGDAAQYLDYVECDPKGDNANPDECVAKGIEGYPTWIYQGKLYSGQKPLSDLAAIVGFSE